MYSYLCKHPQIVSSVRKEVNYWTEHYSAGKDWYLANFMPIPQNCPLIAGEATIDCFNHEKAPFRMAADRPDMKFILQLRDPVERAYSDYHQHVRDGSEKREWEAVVEEEISRCTRCPVNEDEMPEETKRSYLLNGAVLPFLLRWMNLFPREQLLILHTQELFDDELACADRVFDFLGLPHRSLGKLHGENVGKYSPMATALEQRLRQWYEPHQLALETFLRGNPA